MRAAIFITLDEILKSHINPFDTHRALLFMYPKMKWFPAINVAVYVYSHIANANPMLAKEEIDILCNCIN